MIKNLAVALVVGAGIFAGAGVAMAEPHPTPQLSDPHSPPVGDNWTDYYNDCFEHGWGCYIAPSDYPDPAPWENDDSINHLDPDLPTAFEVLPQG